MWGNVLNKEFTFNSDGGDTSAVGNIVVDDVDSFAKFKYLCKKLVITNEKIMGSF